VVVLTAAALAGSLLPMRADVAQADVPLGADEQALVDQRIQDLVEMADATVEAGTASGLETPTPGARPRSAEVAPQPAEALAPPAPAPDVPNFTYLDHIADLGSVPLGLVDEPTDGQLDALVDGVTAGTDLLTPEPAVVDPVAPVPPGEPTLPPGDYTPSSVAVENPDGTTTTSVAATDRYVQTDTGWVAFDPTIAAAATPDVVGQVETSAGLVQFGADPTALVTIATDDGTVALGADDLTLVAPPVVDGDQVTYTDAATGLTVAYQATPNGTKELVTLQGPDSVHALTFHLDDPDGVLGDAEQTQDGGWTFVDPETGDVLATIPTPAGHDATAVGADGRDPLAWDAAAADLEVVAVDDGFDVTLTVDTEWLEGRTYPVSIDPSLVVQEYTGQGPPTEGYVYTGSFCPSNGCTFLPSSTYGFMGPAVYSGLTVAALERWTLWDDNHLSPNRLLPPRAVVDTATYDIPVAGCYAGSGPTCGNTASVDVYGLTGDWTSSDDFSTIIGLQASTPTVSNPSLFFNAPNSWDVAPLVQDWADDPDANFGMSMRAPPVSAGDAGGYWYGSQGTANDPALNITWHPSKPGEPQNLSYDVVGDDIEVDWDEIVTGTWSASYLALLFDTPAITYYFEHPGSPLPTPAGSHDVSLEDGEDTSATFTDVPPGDYTVVVATQNGYEEGGEVYTASAVEDGIQVGEEPLVDVEVLPLSGSASLAPGDGAQVNVTVTNPNDDPIVSNIEMTLDDGLAAIDEFFVTDDDLVTVVRCGAAEAIGTCSWTEDPGRIVEVTDLELPGAGLDPASRTVSFLVQAVSSELACAEAVIDDHVTLGTFLPVEAPADDLEVCGNGLGLEPWWSYVDRPLGPAAAAHVNAANGNLVVQQDNATPVQGHGRQGYVLRSTYNSETPPLTAVGAFGSIGAGWNLNVSTAGETAGLITPTGLSVPSLSAALPQLTAPLATVLIDRDGTRHLFTPQSIEANVVASLDDGGDLANLLDRDSTTPLATGIMSDADFRGLGAVLTDILPTSGLGARLNLCVDTLYEAPRGVHLSMWRFIGVQSPTSSVSCESTQGSNGIVALGYATMRPDRVRQVFSATGQLVSQFDGAGNELRYRYAVDVPSTLTDVGEELDDLAGLTEPLFGAIPFPNVAGLTLGPLMAVYEPGVCREDSGDPITLLLGPTGATPCNRSMTFEYDPFSLGLLSGMSITVTDPAHRTIQYDTVDLLAPRLVLTTVRDGDGNELETWEYSYGADEECGGQQIQMCSITAPVLDVDVNEADDEASETTQFDYEGEQTLLSAAPSLTEITERPVAEATIDGASTNAHTTLTYTEGSTLATRGVRGVSYGAIDEFGRAHLQEEGTSDGDELTAVNRSSERVWDGDSGPGGVVRCQLPAALSGNPDSDLDHHLCQETRASFEDTFTGEPTAWEDHDRVTSFTYNPIGQPTSQTVENGTTDLVTTMGYDIQYRNADGSVDTESDAPSGSGGVSRGARHDGYLYAVSDPVSTLSPRGNTRSSWSGFLAERVVDADSGVHPNVPIDDGVCGAASAHNTGLVCSQTGPEVNGADTGTAYTSDGDDPTTTFTYDTYGQLASSTSPKANDTGDGTPNPGVTEYRYYGDGDVELSDAAHPGEGVNAGGWLASIHDTADVSFETAPEEEEIPDGNFVTFAYDRAGNPVRSWDRDATARNLAEDDTEPVDYRTPAVTGAPPDYTQELHGIGSAEDAIDNPWRYVHERSDQLGHTTRFVLDVRGNAWTIRPPRGIQAGGGNDSFDVRQTFDARDRMLTTLLPEERAAEADWSYQYDEAGNMVTVSDPNGHAMAQDYDRANRQTRVRFTRGDPDEVATPSGCTASGARLPADRIYCEASVAYDGLDQVVNQTDPDGGTTWSAFDGAGRVVSTYTERGGDSSLAWARSSTYFDADGNPLVSCRPTEFPAVSGSCTTGSVHATHRSFDPSGQVLTQFTYRASGNANDPWTYEYDHDGNATLITDPNGHITQQQFDYEDRLHASITPRSNVQTLDGTKDRGLITSRTYSPAGDVLAVQYPDGDWGMTGFDLDDTRGGSGDDPDDDIFSLYSYDAAHRLIDSVEAAPTLGAIVDGLPNDPLSDIESTDTSSNEARVENLRTRRVYDVDGNIIALYDPRAFYSTGSTDPIDDPQAAFMTRIDWDRDGRPIAQWQPYWDRRSERTEWSPIFDTSTDPERNECPAANAGTYHPDDQPGAPSYPNDVGVCVTRVSYDPAGNLLAVRNPSSGTYSGSASPVSDNAGIAGDSGNANQLAHPDWYRNPSRYELRTYTDDNLLAVVNRPNPAYSNAEGWRDGDYDGAADADPEVDPRVDSTSMDYDGSGRWLAVEDLQARFRTRAVYTPDGLLDQQLGEHDSDVDPVDETWVEEQRVEYDYDPDGQRSTVRNQVQYASPAIVDTTTSTYYADGLLESTSQDPDRSGSGGDVVTYGYAYDDVGNPTVTTDPNGVDSTQTFSEDNLLRTTFTPVTSTTVGRTTTFRYDPMGRKRRQNICGPSAPSTTITCDDQTMTVNRDGSLRRQTGFNGETIDYRWYADGVQHQVVDSTSDVTTTTHEYLNGWTRSVIDTAVNSTTPGASGSDPSYEDHQTDFAYFGDGVMRSRYFRDETSPISEVASTGAADGEIERTDTSSMTDARQAEEFTMWNYYWDSLAVLPGVQLVQWQRLHDQAGRLRWQASGVLDDPPGFSPVTTSTTSSTSSTTSTLPPSSPVPTDTTLDIGSFELNDWNPDGTLATRAVLDRPIEQSGHVELATWEYNYDAQNRQAHTTDSTADCDHAVCYHHPDNTGPDGDTFDYVYDGAGRTTSVTNNGGTAETAQYDNAGFRTNYADVDYTAWLDHSVRRTCAEGQTVNGTNCQTYAYDGFGRVADDGCRDYDYDGFDRMTATTFDSTSASCNITTAPATTFAYDGLDRQIFRTQDSQPDKGLYYLGTTSSLIVENTDDINTETAYFVDEAGRPQATQAQNNIEFLHDDGHGNVGLAVNADHGTSPTADSMVACGVRYDPWGTTRPDAPPSTNPNRDRVPIRPCQGGTDETTQSRVLYRDTRRDGSNGTYQWGSRTYDPAAASWMSPDVTRGPAPVTDLSIGVDPLTQNRYSYVNGDPINAADPSGHEPCPPDGCYGSGANEHRYPRDTPEHASAQGSRVSYHGEVTQHETIEPEPVVDPLPPLGFDDCVQQLNCSFEYFESITIDARNDWLEWLQSAMDRRYNVGGWWNAVLGVMDFQANEGLVTSGNWWSHVNAGILTNIQDGFAIAEGVADDSQHRRASELWTSFLGMRQSGSTDPQSLEATRSAWATAEQASTDFGAETAQDRNIDPSRREDLFLGITNVFRGQREDPTLPAGGGREMFEFYQNLWFSPTSRSSVTRGATSIWASTAPIVRTQDASVAARLAQSANDLVLGWPF
jgi:RHS repeat-associated protein